MARLLFDALRSGKPDKEVKKLRVTIRLLLRVDKDGKDKKQENDVAALSDIHIIKFRLMQRSLEPAHVCPWKTCVDRLVHISFAETAPQYRKRLEKYTPGSITTFNVVDYLKALRDTEEFVKKRLIEGTRFYPTPNKLNKNSSLREYQEAFSPSPFDRQKTPPR
ncbi:Uu.00g122940.m01.CDS01 [Anthostomella pinea]|uniref:Uu.00g122940.m01.CDS01 n=1 Tax=Anthostomella pinea TaxID=933095 RepID=A0AAI8VI92_9PEZI|nr:Uu.00g122940.m01.CDS01 [Anthostomella pinea]